jgi:hypothetical protein
MIMSQATPALLSIMAKAASFGDGGFTAKDIDLEHRTDDFRAAYSEAISAGLIVPICALNTADQQTGRLMVSPHVTLTASL